MINTPHKLPNLFIGGSAKCGTTTLYHYLKTHPEIYMSPQKETWFFCPSDVGYTGPKRLFFPRDWEKYSALFAQADHQKYRGEATPSYICFDESIARIKHHTKDPKFIFSLRSPADRLYSNFRMMIRLERINLTYEDYFKKHLNKYADGDVSSNLIQGLYAQRLKKYIEAFGAENVHIMIFERWTKNPQKELDNCFKFLNIEPIELQEKLHHHLGVDQTEVVTVQTLKFWQTIRETKFGEFLRRYQLQKPIKNLMLALRPSPVQQRTVHSRVIDFYKQDVSELRELLNDRLSEWDKDFYL